MQKQPTSRMCFVCGENNPAGLHARFYNQEDGSVLARFTGNEYHQGYPGRMHGGAISAIMDEVMGRAIMNRHGGAVWGVTVELTIRFVRPVPLGVELTAVGRVVSENARVFEGSGELCLLDGTVAVRATGKFIKLAIQQIGDFDPEREQWKVRPD
jgi:uncharacterized protein (TIGR00369 family)